MKATFRSTYGQTPWTQPIISEANQGARLLTEFPLETDISVKQKAPAGEAKPQRRPRKIALAAKNVTTASLKQMSFPTVAPGLPALPPVKPVPLASPVFERRNTCRRHSGTS